MDIAQRIVEARFKIDRKKRLDWNERQMESAIKGVAASLKDIHENKLWQDDYASFEEYCDKRWGMTRQRAYQLIGSESGRLMLAAETANDAELAPVVAALNDSQAEQFKDVPKERAIDVLREAITNPGKMTANKIKQAKARVIGTEPNLPMHTETLPKCGGHRDGWHSTGSMQEITLDIQAGIHDSIPHEHHPRKNHRTAHAGRAGHERTVDRITRRTLWRWYCHGA